MSIPSETSENVPKAELLYQAGVQKYEAQEYNVAIDLFSKGIAIQPQSAQLYFARGNAWEDSGNGVIAEFDYIKSVEIEPNNSNYTFRLGFLYSTRQEYTKAINLLEESLKFWHEPIRFTHEEKRRNKWMTVNRQTILGNLGTFYAQLKKYEEAIHYSMAAIDLDPKYSNPYITMSVVLDEVGRFDEGKQFMRKAADLGNENAKAIMLPIDAEDADQFLLKKFQDEIIKNVKSIVRVSGNGEISVNSIIMEAIYYSCDILLKIMDDEQRFPHNYTITDMVRRSSNVMLKLFPDDYTKLHADSAQDIVRQKLSDPFNLRNEVANYYYKIRK